MTFTKYGPKGGWSPTLGDPCALCGKPLAVGDYTTLIKRADDARYADHGLEVHWDCAVPVASAS